MTGASSAEVAADALIGPDACAVVVALGAQAVLYRRGGHSLLVPERASFAVVDTTDAGDAFKHCFACALA